MHLAFERVEAAAGPRLVTIAESTDLVLRDVVIANRAHPIAGNDNFAILARQMVPGLDPGGDGGPAARGRILHYDQRLVLHAAAEEIAGNRADARRGAAEDEIKQVGEMNRVGEHDAGIVARPFEPAETSAQDADLTEFSGADRVAHPLRGAIESEDVADLQDA